MLRRRMPSTASGSARTPSSSGPRWIIAAIMLRTRVSATLLLTADHAADSAHALLMYRGPACNCHTRLRRNCAPRQIAQMSKAMRSRGAPCLLAGRIGAQRPLRKQGILRMMQVGMENKTKPAGAVHSRHIAIAAC